MAGTTEMAQKGDALATHVAEKLPLLDSLPKDHALSIALAVGAATLVGLLVMALLSRKKAGNTEVGGSVERRISRIEVRLQDLHAMLGSLIGHSREDLGFVKAEMLDIRHLLDNHDSSGQREEAAAIVSSNLLNYIQSSREETNLVRKEIAEMRSVLEDLRKERRELLEKVAPDTSRQPAQKLRIEKVSISSPEGEAPELAPPTRTRDHEETRDVASSSSPKIRRAAASRSGNASFFLD